MSRRSAVIALALSGLTPVLMAGDWPQFRGPGMSGVSDETDLPTQWGPSENIRWSTVLPGRGVSSPVVVGNRVFLTACSGLNESRLYVFCFDADSGARVWERQFWATGPTNCNPKTCVAAPTPVANANQVIALFATGDLVCLEHSGVVRWLRALQIDYPAMSNLVGRAASPVLYDGIAIVSLENQGASFLLGVDSTSGRNRWKVERPLENNYTTPLVVHTSDRAEVVVQAKGGLTAYDPATGALRWELPDESVSSVASPATGEGLILGVGREMLAVRPNHSGRPEVVWRSARINSGTPTAVTAAGKIYAIKDAGLLACGDLASGKQIWTLRLRGAFSASPVLAGDKLYAVNEDGDTTVVKLGGKPERVAINSLGETMLASPAIARGCIFLRSDAHLFCIGKSR
jgi:outer membrane protein assembly factor BamB